jgi:hypothetical protein
MGAHQRPRSPVGYLKPATLRQLREDVEREVINRARVGADLTGALTLLDRVESRLAQGDGTDTPTLERRMAISAQRSPPKASI